MSFSSEFTYKDEDIKELSDNIDDLPFEGFSENKANDFEIVQNEVASATRNEDKIDDKILWTEAEADFLLEKYREYKNEATIRYPRKSDFCHQISLDLTKKFNRIKTAEQCYSKLHKKYSSVRSGINPDIIYVTGQKRGSSSTVGDNRKNRHKTISGFELIQQTYLELEKVKKQNNDRRNKEMMALYGQFFAKKGK